MEFSVPARSTVAWQFGAHRVVMEVRRLVCPGITAHPLCEFVGSGFLTTLRSSVMEFCMHQPKQLRSHTPVILSYKHDDVENDRKQHDWQFFIIIAGNNA